MVSNLKIKKTIIFSDLYTNNVVINNLIYIYKCNLFIIQYIKIINNQIHFYILLKYFKYFIQFLKNHFELQFILLTDCFATDRLSWNSLKLINMPKNKFRFEITYILTSILLNLRTAIHIFVSQKNSLLISLSSIF